MKYFKDALKECDILSHHFSTESQIHTLKGKIYYEMGNFEEAHKSFVSAANFEKKDSQKIKELIDNLQKEQY